MSKVILLLACLAIAASAKVTKRQTSHEFGNKNYYFETLVKANFHNAFMFCQRMGMQLLTINSNEEYDYIFGVLTRQLNFGRNSKFWTSGSDIGQEGRFNWMSTGFPVNINKWLPRQPDNGGGDENCIEIWNNSGNIGLNDEQCYVESHFICESNKH